MAAVELLDAVAELHLSEGLDVGDDPVALVRAARHPRHQLRHGLPGDQRLHQQHAVVQRHLSYRTRAGAEVFSLLLPDVIPRLAFALRCRRRRRRRLSFASDDPNWGCLGVLLVGP